LQCRHSGQSERENHRKRGLRGYDAGKKILGRKRHLLVDTLGLILVAVVHAGDIQDRDGARLVLDESAAGPRVVNFASILKYDSVPLAKTLSLVLDIVKGAMGTPVEIEFAVDLGGGGRRPEFHLLQIKPLLGNLEEYRLEVESLARERLLLRPRSPAEQGQQPKQDQQHGHE
jgi:hypothetical protein